MTYGDIKNADYEEIKQRKAEREKEVLEALNNLLSESGYEVFGIDINFERYKESGSISYRFKLSDGFEQEDIHRWHWKESIEEAVEKIKKRIDYIVELRQQYPDLARQNDYIQKHREYGRICKLYDEDSPREVRLQAELCGYLKLPNTTNYSVGGGDYELKKTPRRVKDFNGNIDRLCLFLADCIGELKRMKLKENESE
ncbi:hypothetical protein C810_01473 [Lachnospiraceae bacterium A2]|nr:hypothetical protein C810_01473 [Lachnospiraceae bacterium A2]